MTSICSWLMLCVGLQRDENYRAYQEWIKHDATEPPAYYPQVTADGYETIAGGELVHLDILLKRQPETLVFRLKDGRIIRYQANCLRSSDHHPVARHYFFLNLLKDTRVAPQVYALSGPRALGKEKGLTDDFDLEDRKKCVDNGGTVRFMIMEDVGFNMLDWIWAQEKRISFDWSVATFRNLMNKIKTIHAFGIVHGDIHPLNVMSKRLPDVKLIDFELSQFPSEISWTRKQGLKHVYFSHWEMSGYSSSFRDDVFRGVLVGAVLIGGAKWYKHCRTLNQADMLKLKSELFLFEILGVFELDELIPDSDKRSKIREQLEKVLRLARDPSYISSMPDIDGIIGSLDAIVQLV